MCGPSGADILFFIDNKGPANYAAKNNPFFPHSWRRAEEEEEVRGDESTMSTYCQRRHTLFLIHTLSPGGGAGRKRRRKRKRRR